MLSKKAFIEQLFDVKDEYREDNQWVGDWDNSWNDDNVMTEFIAYAYNLYAATATNRLKLTLLGGTEIRLDDPYVRNFGVTAVNGIQDKETKKIVRQQRVERFKNAINNDQTYVRTSRGVGSILSEKGWTPILNDALIIGATRARQGFTLALTPGEQDGWNDLNGNKLGHGEAAEKRLLKEFQMTKFGGTKTLIDAWKAFFNSQKRMFIDNKTGAPRVFVRELLGLYFAGYKPEFSWQQLGFSANDNKHMDFKIYLQKLREVGFHTRDARDLRKIMATVSEFLFNDKKAIGDPWPVNTKVLG